MAITYARNLVHIAFATRYQAAVLLPEYRTTLYNYMRTYLAEKECGVLCIGGGDDHVHLLLEVGPTLRLATVVKDLKLSTWVLIRDRLKIKKFPGWKKGYLALSIDPKDQRLVTEYILLNHVYHIEHGFDHEMDRLCTEHGLDYQGFQDH